MRFRTIEEAIEQAATFADALTLTGAPDDAPAWGNGVACALMSRPDVTAHAIDAVIAATNAHDAPRKAIVRNPAALTHAPKVLTSAMSHRLVTDGREDLFRTIVEVAADRPGHSQWSEALTALRSRLGGEAYDALVREVIGDEPGWQGRLALSALMSSTYTGEVLNWVPGAPNAPEVMQRILEREHYDVEHVEGIYAWLSTADAHDTHWCWDAAIAGRRSTGGDVSPLSPKAAPAPARLALLRIIAERTAHEPVVARVWTMAKGDPHIVATVLARGKWTIASDATNLGATPLPVDVVTAALTEMAEQAFMGGMPAVNLILHTDSVAPLDLVLSILDHTESSKEAAAFALSDRAVGVLIAHDSRAVARRQASAVLDGMARHDWPEVRAAVVPHLLAADARAATSDGAAMVRQAYAKRPDAHPADLLTLLDDIEGIALTAIGNPGATVEVITAAAHSRYPSVRRAAGERFMAALDG